MANNIFRIFRQDEYRKAGPDDLIELLPVPGNHPLFIVKWVLEVLVYGLVYHEFIHLSGPTGTAKSSLIEALYREPENFLLVCKALGFQELPVKIYPIEMVTYETPGELYERRSLKDGTTYDEKSGLIQSLEMAVQSIGKDYPVIWLREMGRVHTASVQGGLLDLMSINDIILSDSTRINGCGIAWVADSNYQALEDSTHTLVSFDDALKRRFTINVTLDYLSPEQETHILKHIFRVNKGQTCELIKKVVHLGKIIRDQRSEGNLQSLPPPSIWGYMAFIRMAQRLNRVSLQQISISTLLGNAGSEDKKLIRPIMNEVFGLQTKTHEDNPTKVAML